MATILILFCTISVYGQVDINQWTDKGQKTGKWIAYYNNGKIDEVSFYEPTNEKMSAEDAFFNGIGAGEDSTFYHEKLIWTEKYEYHEDWSLIRVIRTHSSKGTTYLYGPNMEITLTTASFDIIDKVDNTTSIRLEALNNSDKPITLTPKFSHTSITMEQQELTIPPHQATTLFFELKLEPSDQNYLVTLVNDSISIEIAIQTFGYHIESKHFEAGHLLTIPKNFIYYRTGDEALLKIYDKERGNVLDNVSLARQKSSVELGHIRPGDYWIGIVNYSNETETFCKARIVK